MKKLLPLLVATFLLSAILPVRATLIVYGTISGVVTSVSNPLNDLRTTVGMSVSGTFSYDYDFLSPPDSSGDRTDYDYFSDPNASFSIRSSVGEGGGAGFSNLTLTVDANGLPIYGDGLGEPDLGIGPSSVGVIYGPYNNIPIDWEASVTYTITSFTPVPDTGATWFLLGLGLAGVTVARHFFRRTRA